jgi:hypothetical protein
MGLIATGVVLALLVVFAVWRRIAPRLAFGLLAAAGTAVGAGGLLIQEHAGIGDWVITIGALGVLAPIHMRLVFGRPGGGVVAEAPPAA